MSSFSAPLAILGDEPAFSQPLHVNRPNIGSREAFLSRIQRMLDDRWFTNDGPFVAELETRIARRVGVRHCVVTVNGTVALRLAVRAAHLSGEVLVPSFTFIATAHALAWEGLTPVFCDVEPQHWTLDPAACEAAVTPATSAILGVHVYGRPCDVARLSALAERRGLALLFDAAHAFGCTQRGRSIGSFGRAEVFSFHATKAFHTFEGGAVVTDDDVLAAEVRLRRNFGFRGCDDVGMLGLNGKMPEVCAAMGLANLEAFEDLVAANRASYEAYAKGLAGLDGLRLRPYSSGEQHNWQYVVVEIDAIATGLTRDTLLRVLAADNILARRYFYPGCHAMEPYRSRDPSSVQRLPRTLDAAAKVLVLPGGQCVPPAVAERVCAVIRAALSRASEIREVCSRGDAVL